MVDTHLSQEENAAGLTESLEKIAVFTSNNTLVVAADRFECCTTHNLAFALREVNAEAPSNAKERIKEEVVHD